VTAGWVRVVAEKTVERLNARADRELVIHGRTGRIRDAVALHCLTPGFAALIAGALVRPAESVPVSAR
jgi:hypothetical protein